MKKLQNTGFCKSHTTVLFLITAIFFFVNTQTIRAQATCATAINMATLPYNGAGLTNCGLGNIGIPGCLSSTYFAGNNYILTYTPAANQCINTTVTIPTSTTYSGVAIIDRCPTTAGASCVAQASGVNKTSFILNNVSLTAGTTYYFLVSGGKIASTLYCMGFSINVGDCSQACVSATNIGSLPYNGTGLTNCGAGNSYTGTPACLDNQHFGGDQKIFKYTPAANQCINTSVTISSSATYSGYAILDKCPNAAGAACLGVQSGTNSTGFAINNVSLTAGTTYYFIVAGGVTGSGLCMPFSLKVTDCSAACLTATNIPSVPYTQTGFTNCGAGASFSGTPACLTPTGFAGEDYVFTYTPPANICITAKATYTTAIPWNSGFAILDKCPTAAGASCVAVKTGDFQVGSLTLSNVSLTAGTTYYFVVSGGQKLISAPPEECMGFNFDVKECPIPPPPLPNTPQGIECGSNLGFENGDLSLWTGYTDVNTQTPLTVGLVPGVTSVNGTQGTCGATAGWTGARQTRTTGAGFDPNTDNVVPVVAPGCRTSSVRIGNDECGYQSEAMEQTFLVTTSNVLFTYLYAVVLQDPGHIDANQPRFEITMKDNGANIITCGGVYSITSTNASADGFVNATAPACGGNSVWYKNWTAVGTDLTPYLGSNITIRFTTSDCTQGGHFGYAYVDTYCKPKEILGTTVCTTGGAITLTAPAGFSNYVWHIGSSSGPVSGTGQTKIVNPANNGDIYTVEFKSIVGTSCTSYVTDTIKVITANAVGDTTICNGTVGTKKLTASSNDPTATYSWVSSPAGFTSTQAIPTVTLPNTTTIYTVTVSSTLGCTITKVVTITVNPPPTVTVNSPSVCPGVGATLTAGGATTYVWSTGATTTSISVSPTVNTSYTVTGTLGCTSSAVAVVSINPPLVATASANTPCEGATLNLTSTGGTSWSWTGPGGYTSTSQNPTRPSSTIAMNGVYTVVVNTAGCTGSATVNVTVNPLPVVTVNSATICPGGTATLTATGGTTYLWSSGETTTAVTKSPAGTTSYTVTGTSAGCSASAVATVTVGSILTVNVNSPTICAGASATLNATGATAYTWSTGETTTSITVTPAGTSTYSITGTSAGCSGSGTATVTVNPIPPATAAANTPCAGTALNLTSTGGTTWSWSGPGAYTSTSQNPTIPSATVAMNGVYTITVTSLGCTNTATVNVTVNPLPVITVNSPTVCSGITATLTANGGATYLWSTGATTTSISVTPLVTTSYTVTGTTLGCTGSALAVVTVTPPCGVSITAIGSVVCQGVCGTVSATATNGVLPYTYTWSNGATTSSQNLCPAATTTYTVTVSDNSVPITTATATAVITVNPNPVVSLTDAAICFGGSTTLTAGGIADTYTWIPTTGLTPATGATVTANPTTTTTYTVTGTIAATGCTGVSTVVVTVNPIPTITVPGASICIGGSTPLTAGGADTYTWTPSATLSSGTGTTVTANPAVNTTYTITGTTLAGCTGSTTAVVAVGVLIPDAGPDKSICSGSSTVLNATGGSGYSWSPGTGLSNTTIFNPIANPTVTTTYTVTVTSGLCIETDAVIVIVDPPIVLNIAGFPPKCAGGTDGQAVVIPSGGDGVYSYQWAPVAGTGPSVNGPAGTYTVIVTDQFGCSASASTVVPDPTPVIGTTSVITAHCNKSDGSATVATVSGGTGTYTYSWNTTPVQNTQTASNIPAGTYVVTVTDGNGCTITISAIVPDASGITTSIVNSTNVSCFGGTDGTATATGNGGTPGYTYLWNNGQNTNNATNLSAGTYTVSVTDMNGCSAKTTITITQPTPVVLTSTNGVMCPLTSATITTNGSGGTGAISYSWNPGALTGPSVTVSPAVTTTYTITGTDANGCTGVTTAVVTVNPVPVITVPDDTICEGKSTTLTASGANTYTWSPATGLSPSTGSPVIANPLVTTIYTVIGTDGNGCTNSTNVVVTVNPLPVIVVPPASICPGDSTLLTASGAVTYSWSPATGITPTTGTTVKATPKNTTTYMVTGTNTFGCTSVTPVIVTVHPKPNANFTANPNPASIFDPTVNFTDHTNGGITWNWTLGDKKPSTSNKQNPSFTYPDSAGTYKVRLIVTNQFGCIDTTYGTVIIKGEYSFFIPNTFTPNGDGTNDYFFPKGTGIDETDYDLWIFDRWGNLIWHTETWGEQWDGRANYGQDVAQIDTYVWKVHVREKDSQIVHNYIGHVNIVK